VRGRLEAAGSAPAALRSSDAPGDAYRAARGNVSEAARRIVFGSFLTVAAALS